MSNVKISALPAATTPLTGTELVPLVQSGVTSQVAVSNIKTAPAGSNTQVQFNNSSAFGASASLTWDGTSLTATKLAGAHNGTVGATTPSTGAFTTLTSTLDATIYGLTVGRGGGAVSTNTAVGYEAAYSNTAGAYNAVLGYQAGKYFTGGGNLIIGSRTLGSSGTPCTGNYNTIVGDSAGAALQGANSSNTFVGNSSGGVANTGSGNQFFGYGSGGSVTSGSKNVILGSYTGSAAPISATGSNYVVLSDGDANIVASTKTAQTFALQGGTLSAGTGIAFPATQSASTNANTLDDYEEGTWTGTSANITVTSGTPVYAGKYTKVGNLVHTELRINGTYNITIAAANTIAGGPFTTVQDCMSGVGGTDGTPSIGGGQGTVETSGTLTYFAFSGTFNSGFSFSANYLTS